MTIYNILYEKTPFLSIGIFHKNKRFPISYQVHFWKSEEKSRFFLKAVANFLSVWYNIIIKKQGALQHI